MFKYLLLMYIVCVFCLCYNVLYRHRTRRRTQHQSRRRAPHRIPHRIQHQSQLVVLCRVPTPLVCRARVAPSRRAAVCRRRLATVVVAALWLLALQYVCFCFLVCVLVLFCYYYCVIVVFFFVGFIFIYVLFCPKHFSKTLVQ